jgi:asparagine synthase (glutamine-hydrolysing)
VFGARRTTPAAGDDPAPAAGPRATLEPILIAALERSPCVVAFSGGRDSAAILAAATTVARANGLPDPVPHTIRFAAAPRTEEDDWQELTVAHLGLAEWSRRELGEELDALGPAATEVIDLLGPHWPANLHSFHFLLEPASDGSLVTGAGGDELFGPWNGHRAALLRRLRAVPRRDDVRPLLRRLLPTPVLAEWWVRRGRLGMGWLRHEPAREVARGLAIDRAGKEVDWAEAMEGYLGSRYIELAVSGAEALADRKGVHLSQPFLDPAYVRAVCADAPRDGFPSRAAAMERHFGDVLPDEVPARSGKAIFSEVFFGPRMRAFARGWDGAGLDPDLVDTELLRAEWLKPRPQFCSLVPIQAAWAAR